MSDEISRLLQAEIDAARSDIDMRSRLVRALAAYNDDLRVARERLRHELLSALGLGVQRGSGPSLDELQAVMNQWQRQH